MGDTEKTKVDSKETQKTVEKDILGPLDLTKSSIKDGVIVKLEGLYSDFSGKITDEAQKKELEKKYNEIKEQIKACKNDGDLKNIYDEVKIKINSWIDEISNVPDIAMGFVGLSLDDKEKAVLGLKDLRVELAKVASKDEQEKLKKEIVEEKKQQESSSSDEKTEFTKLLTDKFKVPSVVAGVLATLAGMIGLIGKGKDGKPGFFSGIMGWIKDPIGKVKEQFGFGKKETSTDVASSSSDVASTATAENDNKDKGGDNTKKDDKKNDEPVVSKGEVKTYEKTVEYTNTGLHIKITDKKLDTFTINGKEYKLNIKNQPDFAYGNFQIRDINGKDYLTIGDKDIDLNDFVESIKEEKESYVLCKNFRLGQDLEVKV